MMNKKLIALLITVATVSAISADGLFRGAVDTAQDTTNFGLGLVSGATGSEGPVEKVEAGREGREARREEERERKREEEERKRIEREEREARKYSR